MKTATTVASMLARLTGLIQIVLGVLFWTGNAINLISLHILSGTVLVLSLWTLAILARRSGLRAGVVGLSMILGLITLALGLVQSDLLVNSSHWIIQVVHLLLGLSAIGLAEVLAARIKHDRMPEKTLTGQPERTD